MSEELNKWQKTQSRKINPDRDSEAPAVASLPSYFNRICRLDPPHDWLASLLFLEAPLHSLDGWRALEDMINLYRENPQVAYCPSLRPENGCCLVSGCAKEIDR